MDKVQAEESIKVIREIMERSARYTNFSGISGVVAGIMALIGCAATYLIFDRVPLEAQNRWYTVAWVAVFAAAIAQDFAFAQAKARKRGESMWAPATCQVIKAVLPGIFIAFVVSLRALSMGDIDTIPAIWALGYGAAAYAAGMFSIRDVRVFGIVQLITGAVGLIWFPYWIYSLVLLGLSFGVYHILFGLWMMRKYGR